ncbi:MAG TPA: energy transducer TonB [Allosphingosinicella sp.]|nr:energy transducer TonB [Allosphingosinicella sp.]
MFLDSPPQDRLRAAAPVLAVHALLALLILRSLGFTPGLVAPETLQLVDIPPPPPPIPVVRPLPERSEGGRREGAAAPANREARPTELVAPPPVLPPVNPLPAAPVASPGIAPISGATPLAGPGTGAGGVGSGTGSGRFGDGPGRGGDGGGDGTGYGDGDGGGYSPPRRIRGRISDRDYPREAGDAGVGGIVSVIYAIEPDGRATDCRITRSSGSRALDLTTCRLIEQRFVFEPSRDRRGRPVRSRMVQDHYWEVEDLPPDPEEPRRRRRFGF